MPELPEVETVVRDLRPMLVGQRIAEVLVGKPKLRRPWKPAWTRVLAEARIEAVGRRGKWIRIALDGDRTLVIHLGMTGQLTVADVSAPKQDHTHLIFVLNDGRELRFRDVRRFGSADLFYTGDALDEFLNARLGPEPFDLEVDAFRSAIRSSVPVPESSSSRSNDCGRSRQHLRGRSVLSGPVTPRPARPNADGRRVRPTPEFPHCRPEPGDRRPRIDHSRLRRRFRVDGNIPGRVSCLRPNGGAVPDLYDSD